MREHCCLFDQSRSGGLRTLTPIKTALFAQTIAPNPTHREFPVSHSQGETMESERDLSETKSEIQRKLYIYKKPIPSEIVPVVASDDPDSDPDRDAVNCAEDSDSSDSENWDGNSDKGEVVPNKIPVPAPTQIKITIPAPPIKNSAVPQIKVPVTVPQVVRQIENNSESKENHQASDLSSDDDVGRYMIRRRDRELKMPASDSSEDIGSYELKRRETPIKTQIKNLNSDSDSSLEVARSVFKRRESHMETGDSLSDSEDSEDIEIPTTSLRWRFRRRGIALRWRRNSLLILSLTLRRRVQFLVAKRRGM